MEILSAGGEAVEEREGLKKRFKELADKSWQNNVYLFTGFLGLSELSCFYEMERELSFVPAQVFGGYEGADRSNQPFQQIPEADR